MAWHYLDNGKIEGPLSDAEFALKRASLDPSSMVWRDGMKEWQRLESVAAEAEEIPLRRRHFSRPKSAARPPRIEGALGGSEGDYVLEPAGFGIRLAAFVVDKLIFMLALGHFAGSGFMTMASGWQWHFGDGWQDAMLPTLSGFSVSLLEFVYEVVMIAEFEATLGKLLFGLKVRHEGERLSYGRSLARALAKKLSGWILFIGYIMILFDKDKLALHDRICSTRVTKD